MVERRWGHTFLRTLAETLGRGIACSDSPTSAERAQRVSAGVRRPRGLMRGRRLTLEHVADQDRAVCDIAVDLELLVVRRLEGDLLVRHCGRGEAGGDGVGATRR